MIDQNLIELYAQNFCESWDLPALTNYDTDVAYTYAELAEAIARRHLIFEHLGIQSGDHIALMGKDTAEWCISFMATITYGAVIVPILQDFNVADASGIVAQSDARLLVIDRSIYETFDQQADSLDALVAVLDTTTLELLSSPIDKTVVEALGEIDDAFRAKYPDGFERKDVIYPQVSNEDMSVINYTSGTTGFSKGVILTANNLAGNVTYAMTLGLMNRGDKELCFLPLAHVYSCAFNMLTPLAVGAHVFLLGKVPSPKIITKAFQTVRPNLIITVPLIFEKIYKEMILPKLKKRSTALLLKLPGIGHLIRRAIRSKLMSGMGANFHQVIVGGAPLNPEVEAFLTQIRFPFTVGYGMTECAPLICYEHWYNRQLYSCGKGLRGIMEVRIDTRAGLYAEGVGEIQCRGENVCKGYYKNPEMTQALFTSDGWMHTGDLGTKDDAGNIFIKGRSKTMILGANGQNIYPEEIESKINNLPYILESLVVERRGRLVALIVLDQIAIARDTLTVDQAIASVMASRRVINDAVGLYEKITAFEIHDEEFAKTPKRSIKRFLYS